MNNTEQKSQHSITPKEAQLYAEIKTTKDIIKEQIKNTETIIEHCKNNNLQATQLQQEDVKLNLIEVNSFIERYCPTYKSITLPD